MIEIIAAIIGLGGAIFCTFLAWWLQRFRSENDAQHAEGRALIEAVHETARSTNDAVRDVRGDVKEIRRDVKRLDGRVDALERGESAQASN